MTSTTLQLSEPDRTVAFLDTGAGPVVVMVHGVGMQSAAWAPQIAALEKTHRVIALDMPGHGGSSPLPIGSTLPDYVHWCHQAVLALDVGPVSMMGHSMGALIALGFAVTHPALCTRVALLNGVFQRNAQARTAVEARAGQIAAGQLDLETPLARWFGDSLPERVARAQVAGWLSDMDTEGYATAYSAFAKGDATYADQLDRITCPFLALTGDGDPNSTPEMSQAMAAQVRDGTAVTIKGHRHMVNLTAPELVNAHLRRWLTQSANAKELQ